MKKQHDDQKNPKDPKLEELQGQVEEFKAKYLRAVADYQNLERRSREEKEEVRKYATEIVLGRMLPVVDTLGKLKEHVKDTGLDILYKEVMALLQEQGVEKIQTVGRDFDPHEMECIEVVEGADNKIVEELLPGYLYRGKVLRVAQVKVGKKQTN